MSIGYGISCGLDGGVYYGCSSCYFFSRL